MTKKLIGYGKSYASFGEIVQGRLSNEEDFLVTIPVDMWSTCELICEVVDEPSTVKVNLYKSRLVAKQMLKYLNLEFGYKITINFTRNIPIGKGLSSSTADMLAVVRAFQEVFGIIVSETFISRLFSEIEPHDGLHYYMSVAYNHRQGRILNKLNHIPDYTIIAIDSGGEISTTEYNNKIKFSNKDLFDYDNIYNDLLVAFSNRNDEEIAKCAHRSTLKHIERTDNVLLSKMVQIFADISAIGVIAAHSGTCGGFLLPSTASERFINDIKAEAANLGRVFQTKTLKILL
ncbi:hypothetical protein N9W55_02930 [Amylibacter sp.]|nr:hypothetical protein [Amylibacter sp.]